MTSITDSAITVLTPVHTLANPLVSETVDVSVSVNIGRAFQQSATLAKSYTYRSTAAGTPCNTKPGLYISSISSTTPSVPPGTPDGGETVQIRGAGFFATYATLSPDRVRVEFGGTAATITAPTAKCFRFIEFHPCRWTKEPRATALDPGSEGAALFRFASLYARAMPCVPKVAPPAALARNSWGRS